MYVMFNYDDDDDDSSKEIMGFKLLYDNDDGHTYTHDCCASLKK